MMKAVIYARVSNANEQSEEFLMQQIEVCHEYAKKNGFEVIGEYTDNGTSQDNTKGREGFLRMLSDSEKREFEMVLVYQLDRFARNRYDSATYKTRLKKNGVKVVSVREIISDDASGILMEAVLEGMAEYCSNELENERQH